MGEFFFRPASAALAAQASVDLGQVEFGGVEIAGVIEAEPLQHVLVIIVIWVGERFLQVRVAPRAAAVLRRAGALTSQADWSRAGRQRLPRAGQQGLFQCDEVVPVVAEVVGVADIASSTAGPLGNQ
jgi:hypothetical protein